MIHSVTVTNYLGDQLIMELGKPEESGFLITKIDGLDPPEGDISLTELAATDGSYYNSARVNTRNIVIYLKLLFAKTVEEARLMSYKYFPVKKNINLLIETDNRLAMIDGYVETNSVDIFSDSETAQISILCPYPYFYSAGEDGNQVTVFSGIEPIFEFSFSNESLTEPLLEFGEIRNKQENLIVYHGDAEVGVKITIHAIGEASNISIYNIHTREVMHIDTDKIETISGQALSAGDDIIINTTVGNKYVHLVRKGVTINILNALDKYSDWFTLSQGDNIFAYTADSGSNNLQFKVENRLLYEGV